MAAHPLLEQARRQVGRYKITPSGNGRFRLWRFSPWSHPMGGWRMLVDDLATRAHAEAHLLSRFGLMDGAPPPPLAPIRASVSWSDPEWL